MADQQYDVSEKFKELFLKKKAQRNETKAYFKKIISNPHRPEGALYDPLLQRYHAMSQYAVEYHRATPRTVSKAFGFLVIPIITVTFWIYYREYSREQLYRSGQIAYKDRLFKRIM